MFDKHYMLLDETTLTADKNGTALDRLWISSTPIVVGLAVTGTISGTSPTLDVKVQMSDDGSNWDDVKSFTQVTTSEAREFIRILCPKKYIRAVADAGGTSPSYGRVQCGVVPAGEFTEPK